MLGLGREPVDVAAVRDAVGAVHDPELQRSLGELNMVRAVTTGRRGRVDVEVALTTAGCPMTELLTRDVTSAAAAVTRSDDVHVSFTVMTESERRALAERFLANRTAKRSASRPKTVSGTGWPWSQVAWMILPSAYCAST